ncbi:MAG TPA: alpha-amylase family glycosyl hydrolase, partial [Afifellaceae bacterium]|nr:alpha-amylase family glycosyl hydrolase [Afifellaceae bacterium]
KSRPENLEFLKEVRRLLEEYPGTAALGEVGDAERRLQLMADYTSGGRLQMCYSFEFLSARFGRAHFESGIRRFEAMAGEGWGCWAFSNHDARRHVSRWQAEGRDPVRFAKFCAALLLSLRGSVCLYQGEELGLPEAEIGYEDLQDPYGIRFWPEFRGRDGARTPMVWQADALNGGFSTGRPWLPVYPLHAGLAVDRQQNDPRSVLAFYRHFLRFRRRHPALIRGAVELLDSEGDVLAFARDGEGERLVCAFNMGTAAARWAPPKGLRLTPLADCGMNGTHVEDGKVHLPPISAFFASAAAAVVRDGEPAPEERRSAAALSSQGAL